MKTALILYADTDGNRCGSECRYLSHYNYNVNAEWLWCEMFRTWIQDGLRCRYCLEAEREAGEMEKGS